MLAYGADPEAKTVDGDTPLSFAVDNSRTKSILELYVADTAKGKAGGADLGEEAVAEDDAMYAELADDSI